MAETLFLNNDAVGSGSLDLPSLGIFLLVVFVCLAFGFLVGWYSGRIAQLDEVVKMGWVRKKKSKR